MKTTITLYLVGIATAILSGLFCSVANGYSKDSHITIPLGIITFTVVVDLIQRTQAGRSNVGKTDPFPDLTEEDRSELISFHKTLRECSKSNVVGGNLLLTKEYTVLQELVNSYKGKADFTYHNLVGANQIFLQHLKPGDSFLGVSILTRVADWDYDERIGTYLATNIEQAAKGVKINRIFVIRSRDDLETLQPIVETLVDAGIKIRYVDEPDVTVHQYYTDITIFPEYKVGLYVTAIRADPPVTFTQSEEELRKLNIQYGKILQLSHEFPTL